MTKLVISLSFNWYVCMRSPHLNLVCQVLSLCDSVENKPGLEHLNVGYLAHLSSHSTCTPPGSIVFVE